MRQKKVDSRMQYFKSIREREEMINQCILFRNILNYFHRVIILYLFNPIFIQSLFFEAFLSVEKSRNEFYSTPPGR